MDSAGDRVRIDAADAERPATRVRGVADLLRERRAHALTLPFDGWGLAMSRPVLDRAQIEHVAELASLSLTEDEIEAMAKELAVIVAYMGELDAVDTENVPPTANVQLERAAWRRDVLEPSLPHEEALSQAPETAHGGFAVPVFVES